VLKESRIILAFHVMKGSVSAAGGYSFKSVALVVKFAREQLMLDVASIVMLGKRSSD